MVLAICLQKKATGLVSTFSLLGWRFLISAIIINILVLNGVIKINLKNKNKKALFFVSIFNPCIYFVAETFGISYTTSTESGVFLASIPVISLLTSTIILKKKPTIFQTLGIVITLIGVIVTVCAVGMTSSLSIIGYVFLLIAVIAYALYFVFVDKANAFTEIEITYAMLMAGAVLFSLLAIIEAIYKGTVNELIVLPFIKNEILLAMLYQGIGCSVIAFFLSNKAVVKIGINGVASFIGVSTVTAILVGKLLLNEKFSFYQLIGALIIVIGVYVANIRKLNLINKISKKSIKSLK